MIKKLRIKLIFQLTKKTEIILYLSFAIFLFLAFFGIQWGFFQPWNSDNMFDKGNRLHREMMMPKDYKKPPAYTYVLYVLIKYPAILISKFFKINPKVCKIYSYWLAKLVPIILHIIGIWLLYKMIKTNFSKKIAAFIVLIYATTASSVMFAHYLTADIPVNFVMIASLFFAQKILYDDRLKNYIFAGLLTGVAFSTKYNGIVIGICFIASHYFKNINSLNSFRKIFKLTFNKKLLSGIFSIIIGAVICNPFMVIDFQRFLDDFIINYRISPVFNGKTDGNVLKFFSVLVQNIGISSFLLFLGGLIFIFFQLVEMVSQSKAIRFEWLKKNKMLLPLMMIPFFIIYFMEFGFYPRLPVRYLFPLVPGLMIISAFFLYKFFRLTEKFNRIFMFQIVLSLIFASMLIYNIICSISVGYRFCLDGRLKAVNWIENNAPAKSIIEYSSKSPHWRYFYKKKFKLIRQPKIHSHLSKWKAIFKDDPLINKYISKLSNKKNKEFFTHQALKKRNPDFLTLNSIDFLHSGIKEIGENFINMLLKNDSGYELVLRTVVNKARFVYPLVMDAYCTEFFIFKKQE